MRPNQNRAIKMTRLIPDPKESIRKQEPSEGAVESVNHEPKSSEDVLPNLSCGSRTLQSAVSIDVLGLRLSNTYEYCFMRVPSPPFSRSMLKTKKPPSLVTTMT